MTRTPLTSPESAVSFGGKVLALSHKLRPVAALLVVAVWLGAPLIAALHVAFEEHAYCVEHGALEELDHAARGDSTREADAKHIQIEPTESSIAHMECVFGEPAVREEFIAVSASAIAAAAPQAPQEPALLDREQPCSSIELLSVAPKSSPPAAV